MGGYLLIFGISLLSGAAPAMDGDTFRPLAYYAYGYDSNIFRVENDTLALSELGTPIQAVTYQQLGIGFDLDWKQGRQRVVFEVQANSTKFDRYGSLLDNTGHNASLDWQWALGNDWSGHLGGSQSRSLGSYANVTGLESNIVTNDGLNFEANYLIHPRWQATFRSNASRYEYSAAALQDSNINIESRTLGTYYLGRTLERIGVEYRLTDGSFPDRPPGVPTLATSYQERRFDLVARWVVDDKTQLNASIGQVQGENANAIGRNYSGLEYRFDGTWALTGKSTLGGSLYRQVTNTTFATANHANTTGASLNYTWQVLPKTSLQTTLSHQYLDYDTTSRQDNVSTASLAAVYEAWGGGQLSASLQHETRNSTLFGYNYNDDSLFLNANLKF